MDKNKNELLITRTFDSPLENIWKYWSNPTYFKKWWGPKDFTCPESKIDFKVGGAYLSCMQDPDGKKFWSTGTYKEIVPGEKIVLADSFADEYGNVVSAEYYGMKGFPMETIVTVSFEKTGEGKTKMTLKHDGIKNLDDKMRVDMELGWNQSFDKLEKNLEGM